MEIMQVTLGERVIPLAIRRHAQARRISLRLSPARNGVILTLPRRASVESGMEFFLSKSDWVLRNVETDAATAFEDGAVIPILGVEYIIRHIAGRGITQLATRDSRFELPVYGDPAFTARRVKDFLKKHLREQCLTRAQEMVKMLGKIIKDIKIRDTRSRWGSCSAKGVLTFNWRLVFAPPDILDYLIAHEVAHLVEMNHSRRFWQVVAHLHPAMQTARHWIKREGHILYRYG